MVRFDMPNKRSNNKRGAKEVRIKTTRAKKKGFTVALAASATGEKLPAAIFKERGGELGKRVKKALTIPDNVRVRATKNGWQTWEEYHHWLRHVYGKQDHWRLLIVVVDDYRPHRSGESIGIANDDSKSEVVIILGGCTSLVQLMDKSVNRPFKTRIQEFWSKWLAEPRAITKMGNLKQPTRQDVIDWVLQA